VRVPDPPFAYTVMQYREKMHLSLAEVRAMPAADLWRDLAMMNLASQYGPESIETSASAPENMRQ
jgi:hypothetical protein